MKHSIEWEKIRELYLKLRETQFCFLGNGEYRLQEIYSAVKKKYSDLCNDSYICCESCKSSQGHTPEWQHRVRTVLGGLKNKKSNVRKGSLRGCWIISE
jgi:hypothetical protein